jgi:hypothetical protein
VRIEQYPMPESKPLWETMFRAIFGEPPVTECPPVFIVLDVEGEPVGFASGYSTSLAEFYIQRIGMVPGHHMHIKLWKKVAEYMKSRGCLYLTGNVRADNRRTLILALRNGWNIYGFRVSTGGEQFVQIIKEL